MKKEKSCGAIVARTRFGKRQILLIKHRNGGHWSFPKGHVENDETEIETARREIMEETGLEVQIDEGFRYTVTYSPKPDTMKDVVYFSACALSEKVVIQQEEIFTARWSTLAQAKQMVTFDNDKKLLEAYSSYIGTALPQCRQ